MALKALLLRKKIEQKNVELEALRTKKTALAQRSAELEAALNEVTEETPAEDRAIVESDIEAFDAENNANDEAIEAAQEEIRSMTAELEALPNENRSAAPAAPAENNHREERNDMNYTRRFREMTFEERSAFVQRDEIQEFLRRFRNLAQQERAVTGGDLLIPEVSLDLLRREVETTSKLAKYLNYRRVPGKARQNVMGAIPEGIWTEMCAKLNELDIVFNQVEVDAYKVGGYVAICNSLLADSDVDLYAEITAVLGGAIGKALDKAVVYGTGTKMPLGIVTRLAQTSQPETWGTNAPTWTDLHTSNIITLNIGSETGAAFFAALAGALGVAKPIFNADGLFWVMNRKTHMDILARSLAFNAAASLTAGIGSTMPVVGGEIIEIEDELMSDGDIVGGFGGNYLLAERQGAGFAQSEHAHFIEDETVFKGTARYDGMPVAGEAFVVINYKNTSPAESKTFPVDYANATMNGLAVTAAAGTAAGDTVLTVAGTIAQSDPVLMYKVAASAAGIEVGDKATGFTSLTSGTTQITAAAGKNIIVVELDSKSRIVSLGEVKSVPKTT